MKAVGYYQSLPIDNEQSLIDVDIPKPAPGPRDLLVQVHAIGVNPVDAKVRKRAAGTEGNPKILGWDVAGIVEAVGAEAKIFRPGDAVFYAGTLNRPGGDSEYHVVDERIVGRKPASLSFADAAALPLTSITAWELLFDRLGVARGKGRVETSLLVVGGAGGVGSILIQLARRLTAATVIATASRPESKQWCLELGAHHVIDHSQPMPPQITALSTPPLMHIASLTQTARHWTGLVEALAPQGRIGLIDDPASLDVLPLKQKCASLAWEYMFARSVYQTPDMIQQHHILEEVSRLIDDKVLRATTGQHLGKINAANLRNAHRLLESGKAIGKLVLEGF